MLGVGSLLKKPTISMLPFGGITSSIMGPVSPTPELKLTGKALTVSSVNYSFSFYYKFLS